MGKKLEVLSRGWRGLLSALYGKIGETAFGITSGIVTTTGLLVGMCAATASKLAVIASLLTLAVADSASDAFAMYMSKISDGASTKESTFRHVVGTLVTKFLMPLTFIIPILIFPLQTGVIVAIAWGGVALAVLSATCAAAKNEKMTPMILRHLALATVIVIFSWLIGVMTQKLMQ